MSLPINHIIGLLSDNLKLRKSVLPLSKKSVTNWAKGLNIPKTGERVLYTGHMYQLMPSIAFLGKIIGMLENSALNKTLGLGRFFNKIINVSMFITWPSRKMRNLYDKRLRNIAEMLTKSGIEYGYLYGKEMYTGALIYDMGVDDVFIKHAHRVYQMLKDKGVTSVITVDPHTTEMLREIYPKYIKDYKLEVKSYLEVLNEVDIKLDNIPDKEVVVHDSCVYARGLDVLDQPVNLLEKAGVNILEFNDSKKLTQCCGGPIESLFPAKSVEIAKKRVSQLNKNGCKEIVSMCPICLFNLQHAAEGTEIQVKDISEYF